MAQVYGVIQRGVSRSFPERHALHESAGSDNDGAASVLVLIGAQAGDALAALPDPTEKRAILIELGDECLGRHTGEQRGEEGSNMLGFSRFRLGDGAPSDLVELVRQKNTSPDALAAARETLEGAGLKVAVCFDFAGRIVDRLVRPYYNAVLRRLDEGLASADDLDLTLRLGLGYPEGPVALLERTGLAHHFNVTQALFEAYGEAPYAPARRARVARDRLDQKAG